VVTARQSCFSEHGTFTDRPTVAPRAQTSQSSFGRPSNSPSVFSGSSTKVRSWSPPPTTSQRYQRAPASHADFDGRNQAQLKMVRIARLSSAPV
jgi:hypothetical protein